MFAKQLLTASVSRCIIQGFSYNLTVPSHVKLVKQCDHLETVKGKQQKYYQQVVLSDMSWPLLDELLLYVLQTFMLPEFY